MSLVTIEMGPTWRMHLLQGLLEERGVPAFVEDVNLKTIDPFLTGALCFDARLRVPEEAVATARAAIDEAREQGLDAAEEAAPHAPEQEPDAQAPVGVPDAEREAMADLARRIRWSALLFWMHPFLFLYGFRYVRWSLRTGRSAPGHGVTLLVLGAVIAFWIGLLALLFPLLESSLAGRA